MRILAIETSALTGSIALWGPDGCIVERGFEGVRNHAHELALRVDELLRANGGLPTIDGYAISIGPGSFTGLRIGVSFLKGLAVVHPRPAVGVSSLEIMAAQAFDASTADRCLAVLDARRGEVFAGLYQRPGRVDDSLPDGLYSAATVREKFAAAGESWSLIGDRVLGLSAHPTWVSDDRAVPLASTVAGRGALRLQRGEGVDAGTLDPAYHQRSAAEVNLGVIVREDAGLNLVRRQGDEVDRDPGRT